MKKVDLNIKNSFPMTGVELRYSRGWLGKIGLHMDSLMKARKLNCVLEVLVSNS